MKDALAVLEELSGKQKPDYGFRDGHIHDQNNPQAGAQPIPGMPGAGPLSGPGKVQADINSGILPENTPLRAPTQQDDQRARKIEEYMRLYNTKRPHSALGYRPPAPETTIPMEQRPIEVVRFV